MQSSGVGNCINMLSLAKSCRFPLTLLITMRGEWGEFNPWQVPMGSKTQPALELMDVLVYRVERAEEAGETVAAALDMAFKGSVAAGGLPWRRGDRAQPGGERLVPARTTARARAARGGRRGAPIPASGGPAGAGP